MFIFIFAIDFPSFASILVVLFICLRFTFCVCFRFNFALWHLWSISLYSQKHFHGATFSLCAIPRKCHEAEVFGYDESLWAFPLSFWFLCFAPMYCDLPLYFWFYVSLRFYCDFISFSASLLLQFCNSRRLSQIYISLFCYMICFCTSIYIWDERSSAMRWSYFAGCFPFAFTESLDKCMEDRKSVV